MEIIKNFNIKTLLIVAILLFAGWVRVQNVGYSDYQGDEIKAFFNPAKDGEYLQFLLDQRKGPNQFIVTGLIKDITDNYQNYFLTRIPFALAGVLSVIVFYFVVRNYFGTNIAIWSSIFFATNGFLIAFSRIVQYQAFVILFGLLGILLYQLFQSSKRYGFLYLSGVSFAISILFHYDGVFFALPVLVTGLWALFQDFRVKDTPKDKKNLFQHLLAVLISVGILLSFYVPFVLNISEQTLSYWQGRITGDVSSKVSSSYYLFTVYQPIYAIHFYILITFMGIFAIIFPYIDQKIKLGMKTDFSSKISLNLLGVLIWGIVPLIMLEIFVGVPGTHIYTYLIPGMILMAYGLNFFYEFVKHNLNKVFTKLYIFGGILLFGFLAAQAHTIFVDNQSGEYPWEDKKFLIFTMNRPTPVFHLSMFGFPYNRNWQGVSEFMKDTPNYYSSNEREPITRYYVKNQKAGDKIGYYIWIEAPQSFTEEIKNERTRTYIKDKEPVFVSSNPSGNKTLIYFVPEDFKLPSNEIIPVINPLTEEN